MPRTDFRARAVKSTIAISIALALAIAALRSAEAATENVYRYSTPQTGYLMLGPADFVPVKSGLQYQTNGNTGIYTTADGDVCFHAPLHLPQQAVFERMTMFYTRPGDAVIAANVVRVNAESTDYYFVANPALSPGPITPRGKVSYPGIASTSVINNRLYNYAVQLCLTKNAAFYNVRIDYTYTSAGD